MKEEVQSNMFNKISLSNFRSIRKANFDLSQLTVFVGANGCGKSNIIKVFEFLSSIASNGIDNTVLSFGGFHSILPKSLKMEERRNAVLNIDYTYSLTKPSKLEAQYLPLEVKHGLTITQPELRRLVLQKETLTFTKPFAVVLALQEELKKQYKLSKEDILKSEITVLRSFNEPDQLLSTPNITKDNLRLFVEWLGLDFLPEDERRKIELEILKKIVTLLLNIKKTAKDQNRTGKQISLLESDKRSILSFSNHASAFLGPLASTRRYDFLQNELRTDQKISSDHQLLHDGSNMPAILRFVKEETPEAWERILETMSKLNPHIQSASSSTLKTGREFIRFKENKLASSVESWEASDGTLRALALLLSLETQPNNSTIVIEEPEQNLHPWAIRSLLKHIRDVIERRGIQVIITTHSQQVLENVNPDEVRIVQRCEVNGTTVRSLKQIMPNHTIEMGEVGRMWVEGLLGGIPDYE